VSKNKQSSGRIWPYAIGASITLVFGFCVATIVVTQKANIQLSDHYMTYYQEADAKANDYIEARIAFDKKYNLEYISEKLTENGSKIVYKITDKAGNPINTAKVKLATSRPETHELNQEFESPSIDNGLYTFQGATFSKAGIWNLIAKVEIGENSRYYNIKADTRHKEAFEF